MAIEGCLNYQRIGLSPPNIVTEATDDYFVFSDYISECLEDSCLRGPEHYGTSRELHQDFTRFMQGRGFVPSEQVFVTRLESIEWLKSTN